MHACMHACMHTRTHTHTDTHTPDCMHACIYGCTHLCMHSCGCSCARASVHTPTHSHAHMHSYHILRNKNVNSCNIHTICMREGGGKRERERERDFILASVCIHTIFIPFACPPHSSHGAVKSLVVCAGALPRGYVCPFASATGVGVVYEREKCVSRCRHA